MRYSVSPFRSEFDERTNALISTAYRAERNSKVSSDIRDLVFQAAILQSSAAMEDYIKRTFDAWAFRVKNTAANCNAIPLRTRISFAKGRLVSHFSALNYNADEAQFLRRLEQETTLWQVLQGDLAIPPHFDGTSVYLERKYPSVKNLKVLYARIGVDNIFDQISRIIRSDAEMRLESFNSLRTALAHAQPPQLTYIDVKRNVLEAQSLVRGMDRVAHKTLSTYIGASIW